MVTNPQDNPPGKNGPVDETLVTNPNALEGGMSPTLEERAPPVPLGEHQDEVDTPQYSSLFSHSCTGMPRRFWIVLLLLVVLVVGVSSLGALLVQRNKGLDVGSDESGKSNLEDNRPTNPPESPPTSPPEGSPTKGPLATSPPTIFKRVGSDLDGKSAHDFICYSVALSSNGTRVAIAGIYNDAIGYDAGHVRMFDWTGSHWTQVGSDLNGQWDGDEFGYSMALSSDGTRVAIGAPSHDMAIGGIPPNGNMVVGQVRIYDWNVSQWTQVGSDFNGEAHYDGFGYSVALSSDGTRVAIGAPNTDRNGYDVGQVRIYDWNLSQWTQVGSDLDGEAAEDYFGRSVALSADGTRLAVGAPEKYGYEGDLGYDDVGYVQIYDWTGSQWTQVGSDLNGEAAGDQFGSSLALSADGTRVAIGAHRHDGNNSIAVYNSGHVRVYDWTGSEWTQVGSDLNGEATYDEFGWSVALSSDGTRVAIGAPWNDGNGYGAGQVRMYDWNVSQWTQVSSDLDGEAAGNEFGSSVALSSNGTRVAICAPNLNSTGDIRVYDVSA
jgi:FG-GAP repeat